MYESVASRVSEITGYKNFLMVNGDDLRVSLMIPKSEISETDLLQHLNDISKMFYENYNLFGFKLKIQETYFSSSLYGFGKLYLIDGYFCSNTLKKGAKLHGFKCTSNSKKKIRKIETELPILT